MQNLSPLQTQVLAGLLTGQPIAAIARHHGIHRSSIYNWRRDHPQFSQAFDQARARLQASLFDETQHLASQALDALAELLESKDNNLKLRAAQTLLHAIPIVRPPLEVNIFRRISTPEKPAVEDPATPKEDAA